MWMCSEKRYQMMQYISRITHLLECMEIRREKAGSLQSLEHRLKTIEFSLNNWYNMAVQGMRR